MSHRNKCAKDCMKQFGLDDFEVLREEPLFIIDGAHNSHGIKALCIL